MTLNNPIFIMIFFLLLFILFYFITYFLNHRKVKMKKYEAIGEMNYLVYKFKLDRKKINYKKEIRVIAALNSFIISSVGTFVTCLDIPLFLQLGIGFVLLFALIYALYEIYGRHLLKLQRSDIK